MMQEQMTGAAMAMPTDTNKAFKVRPLALSLPAPLCEPASGQMHFIPGAQRPGSRLDSPAAFTDTFLCTSHYTSNPHSQGTR